MNESNTESMLFELFPRHKEQPDTQQVYSTTLAAWHQWNSLEKRMKHSESRCAIQNYTLHTIWLPSIQTFISLLRHHSYDTVIVFDTNPSAHPLTTSNSASSLIQLFFGMYYHLILSLLLLWISSNHRSKPTICTTKQFSILYICKYVTFFLLLLLIVNIWSVHADA